MRNIEIFVRLAIVAACIYVSVLAAIDFYSTAKEFANMPPYPLTPHDPMPGDYRKAMWIAFGIHIAASAVAICAAGQYAVHVWIISLLPFHAIPGLFLFVLSLSLLGILGGSIFIAANWVMMLTIIGALIGTAVAGYGLAFFVVVDQEDREIRRRHAQHDARWRS
ncbi:hypothetical protein J7376_12145 [Paracoccus sp. R12_1]|uniref:hypothetical protein n=1 Tax=unclassified Paracoccus (in: a-proteobacteria) TaxID=2688777 RepID=UPI001ADC91C9|nr:MULTISPECIES: hypothetical protein [unclassified Paracoccus (in: a-proteobacteria)]MBO9454645.1 hypothetical protein [Paracoccus sp. R12_2]MBO9487275.1 hypothetical protein [Paracoccus sp. R12_1]